MTAARMLPSAIASPKEGRMTACPRRASTATVTAIFLAATGALLPTPADAAEPAKAAEPAQQRYASPEAAVSALIAAARTGSATALLAVLGADAESIVESGDPVADREGLERFVASYEAAHALEMSGDSRAELVTGKDRWPLPIPIVKEPAGWRFDTEAGEEEILARRIGRNERFTIQAVLAVVDAQREYYAQDPEQDSLLHYARRFFSSEGRRDGLYFPTAEGEEPSPLGPLVAQARAEGYERGEGGQPTPFHGYYYRMLEAQGAHAPGGAYAYVVDGKMLGGFAVVAYPATWDNSGVMTFLVNQDGVVYQKDLGPETEKLARAIQSFDPDDSWKRVPEEDQAPEPDSDSVASE
jgi:hypothetical protein